MPPSPNASSSVGLPAAEDASEADASLDVALGGKGGLVGWIICDDAGVQSKWHLVYTLGTGWKLLKRLPWTIPTMVTIATNSDLRVASSAGDL